MNETGSVYRNIPDSHGVNVYDADPDFARLLAVYLEPQILASMEPHFRRMGELAGGELEALALEADHNPPVLSVRARNGSDEERIHKHPSYQALEDVAFSQFGLAAMSHRGGVFGANAPLPPLVKYGLTYLMVQAEFGLCCPLSMTDALTRALRKFGDDDLIARFIDGLTSQDMDELTQGAMFMTEQTAGSDVGATDTAARMEDGEWKLYGDKWFCSNPDAGLAMVLARPEGGEAGTRGLSLFLLPRLLPDGSRNRYRILRLKDKLGTRSMASGEIVLEGATAYLIGEPGRGFKQMTDMMNMSRLSNGMRAAGLMRRSVNESLFITHNRNAFGRKLVDLPLMRRQIIKMLVTAEQGRSMVFHTSMVLERADAGEALPQKVLRILTPLIKFRTCRDARKVAGDAMEVRGGCGYIEEWSDARVLRDAHLGSIWEGTSNIVALDVARAARREGSVEALREYMQPLLEALDDERGDRALLSDALERAFALLERVANDRAAEADVRVAASAVYNAVSAVFMAWESVQIAARSGDERRRELALMVVKHKLLPRDPLAPPEDDDEAIERLLSTAVPAARENAA